MAVALEQFKIIEIGTSADLDSDTLDAGASAGNLLITTASARWGATGPVGTFTPPTGYGTSPDFEISPMQAHTAALAHKVAAGGEDAVTWTSTETRSCSAVSLYEFSGITSPVLDKTAEDGSNSTSVADINTGSTGTLGASAGLAFLIGLARRSNLDAQLANDAGMAETVDIGVTSGSVSYNECHAWEEFAASTAYDVTVSHSGGLTSAMGAGIATFIAGAVGGGGFIPNLAGQLTPVGEALIGRGGLVV